ncbi:MAG: hypothetical protein INF43_00080, partial [Alphaproteobacteria bacterium]|nr:hypothetical protein [Alphaproteobacteria bacterium]
KHPDTETVDFQDLRLLMRVDTQAGQPSRYQWLATPVAAQASQTGLAEALTTQANACLANLLGLAPQTYDSSDFLLKTTVEQGPTLACHWLRLVWVEDPKAAMVPHGDRLRWLSRAELQRYAVQGLVDYPVLLETVDQAFLTVAQRARGDASLKSLEATWQLPWVEI